MNGVRKLWIWIILGFGREIICKEKIKKIKILTFVLNHYEELGERTCTTYWRMMNWATIFPNNEFSLDVMWAGKVEKIQ
jgi:hypothetical protein